MGGDDVVLVTEPLVEVLVEEVLLDVVEGFWMGQLPSRRRLVLPGHDQDH